MPVMRLNSDLIVIHSDCFFFLFYTYEIFFDEKEFYLQLHFTNKHNPSVWVNLKRLT